MKFFVTMVFILFVGLLIYRFSSKKSGKRKDNTEIKRKAIRLTIGVVIVLLSTLAYVMYRSATAPDTQCTVTHVTTSSPPARLETAIDYFNQGNFDYDTGNCVKAISDYSISIMLNPVFPQVYNNRAYTFMRLRDYKDALPDLNIALALNPNYVQALMNRGDIHNYYFEIDRKSAIEDYKRVISRGGIQTTSVCSHLFLAEHNGWNLMAVLDFPLLLKECN